jgi:hypothetical protein
VSRRPFALVVVALLAVGALATGAHGAGTQGRPAGSPDLAAMALALTDLPAGTRIDSQGYKRDPDFVASYERDFEVRGGRVGRSRLLAAFETLDVERSAADAQLTFQAAAALFRGRQGNRLLKAFLTFEGIDPKAIKIGKIRRPKIGHGAILIPFRVTQSGLTVDFTITLLRFDRILVSVTLASVPRGRVRPADANRVSRVAIARVRAGLVPASVAAPALAGTPQPGQTLTAARGTWRGDQLAYAYQWQRCDAAGAGCVALTGATTATYTVATGDLASTLRVNVTARNRYGSAVASSSASAVVAGPPGSPVATVAPVISGTPQAGATLTSDTGTWSGAPTAFAYQWRRCDASGGACVDIAGATASTYVVSSADSRSTLRVLVVATNAAGPGGAISAPTAAVA